DAAAQLAPGHLGRVAREGEEVVAELRLGAAAVGAVDRRADGEPDERRRARREQPEAPDADPDGGGRAHQRARCEHLGDGEAAHGAEATWGVTGSLEYPAAR